MFIPRTIDMFIFKVEKYNIVFREAGGHSRLPHVDVGYASSLLER